MERADFERSDIVEVTTDKPPRRQHIIVSVDGERSMAQISEKGTGFIRWVPLMELKHVVDIRER